MVKKILLLGLLILFSIGVFGQAKTYVVNRAFQTNSGLIVGSTGSEIDSIKVTTDSVFVYSGGTKYNLINNGIGDEHIFSEVYLNDLTTYMHESSDGQLDFVVNSSTVLSISNSLGTVLYDDMLPNGNNLYDLGTSSFSFRNIYAGTRLTTPTIRINDVNTIIAEDGSSNLTFTDAITGTKTLAELAAGGGGSGDMTAAVYDPTTVAGDAFDMDNMVEGTSLILTASERTNIGTSNTHTSSNGSNHTYIDQSVVSGSTPALTNTNFTEATDKNYVTDAEAVVIGNTSGTNTGNQTITLTGNVTGTGTSSFPTTIVNDAIEEVMLKAVNEPTDEYVLTYESTTGDFEWEASAGGGDMNVSDSNIYYRTITYLDSALTAVQAQLDDTATFYLSAVFGLGSGQTVDTASFAIDAFCGSFRNWTGDTITIDSINAVLLGTTPDIDIQFFISTSITDGSAAELRTTDFNITSTTTGNTFSSFDGTVDVLPEQRIWCKVTAVSTEPTYLEVTLSYKPK